MDIVGGGGTGGGGGGGGGQGKPPPPPRIFAKVAARYSPLVLSPVLHGLPEKLHEKFTKVYRRGRFNDNREHNFFLPIRRYPWHWA